MSAVLHPYEPQRHLLTVEDLTKMVMTGVIAEDARVELIEGELIDMAPINAPHAFSVIRLTHAFVSAARADGLVSIQNSVRLDLKNLPQPDLTLLKPRADGYAARLPTGADILLVVEVADSTLSYDLNRKAPIYASLGITELWVLDVNGRKVIRLRQPTADGYTLRDEIRGRMAPEALPGCVVDLDTLFPV